MVNVAIYEVKTPSESLNFKDLNLVLSRELGDDFAKSEEDELINFILAKEKVDIGQIIGITVANNTKFYMINTFGYEKISIKKETLDLKSLADEKNAIKEVDLENLAKNQKPKKKVRISVIKKLKEFKELIKQRDKNK